LSLRPDDRQDPAAFARRVARRISTELLSRRSLDGLLSQFLSLNHSEIVARVKQGGPDVDSKTAFGSRALPSDYLKKLLDLSAVQFLVFK
jgi:hypothetical protein